MYFYLTATSNDMNRTTAIEVSGETCTTRPPQLSDICVKRRFNLTASWSGGKFRTTTSMGSDTIG